MVRGKKEMAANRDSSQRSAVTGGQAESSLLRQLAWFRGLKDPRDVVLDFIDMESTQKEKLDRTEGTSGKPLSSAETRERLARSASEYISLVIKTSGHACDLASIEFAEEELKVIQVRADFDLRNWLVKILFVIDAAPEKAEEFRKVLNRIEYAVLTAERFSAELEYANRRSDRADSNLLRRKYPFVGRFKTKLNS